MRQRHQMERERSSGSECTQEIFQRERRLVYSKARLANLTGTGRAQRQSFKRQTTKNGGGDDENPKILKDREKKPFSKTALTIENEGKEGRREGAIELEQTKVAASLSSTPHE